MAYYYIEKPYFVGYHAGTKPKNDLNKALKKLGFKSLPNKDKDGNFKLNQNDVVLFYYPFSYTWEEEYYKKLCLTNIHTILFIMDIRSITYKQIKLENEINIYNMAKYIIVHNEKMKQWLIEKNVQQPLFCLGLFDYFLDPGIFEKIPRRLFSHEVTFAGCLIPNLRKFLYDEEFNHKFQLNIYGPDCAANLNKKNKTYFGIYSPEVIPAHLRGSFGLHWNGPSPESCIGEVAEYSKIATSHKISQYLIAGLPIICWEESSEADFIKENKLGFVISNLFEIDVKLESMTENEYKIMAESVHRQSLIMKDGYYFKKVIDEIIDYIEKKKIVVNLEG